MARPKVVICKRCENYLDTRCSLGWPPPEDPEDNACGDFEERKVPVQQPSARMQKPWQQQRHPGRPPIDPTLPWHDRWHAMLSAFSRETGISMGEPTDLLPRSAWIDMWHEDWPGRDLGLEAVLHSDELRDALYDLPRPSPEYEVRVKVWEGFQKVRKAAMKLQALREHYLLPFEVGCAIDLLAEKDIPSPKHERVGRPREVLVDARNRIIRVLSKVRCTNGEPLTQTQITWLLMLTVPHWFLDCDEMRMRRVVEKALDRDELSLPK